jgi:hypothetical protein
MQVNFIQQYYQVPSLPAREEVIKPQKTYVTVLEAIAKIQNEFNGTGRLVSVHA